MIEVKMYRSIEPIIYTEEISSGTVDVRMWEYVAINQREVFNFYSYSKGITSMDEVSHINYIGEILEQVVGEFLIEMKSQSTSQIYNCKLKFDSDDIVILEYYDELNNCLSTTRFQRII